MSPFNPTKVLHYNNQIAPSKKIDIIDEIKETLSQTYQLLRPDHNTRERQRASFDIVRAEASGVWDQIESLN